MGKTLFVFALSQFSRPDYLGAWNRLPVWPITGGSDGGVSTVKTLVKALQSQRDLGCELTAALPCPL